MPLTKAVSFKAVLQKGNRFQVPKLVRWQFKMETGQVLRVRVKAEGSFSGGEGFYAKMSGDGRITLPKLTLNLLQNEGKSLMSHVLEVQLEPAEDVVSNRKSEQLG
jgi:hypothetical protein